MSECLGAAPVVGNPNVPGQGPGTGLWRGSCKGSGEGGGGGDEKKKKTLFFSFFFRPPPPEVRPTYPAGPADRTDLVDRSQPIGSAT